MTAIVLNTLNGAVTEYSNFDFDSITPSHAGATSGLYVLGGDTDAGAKIVARVVTPKKEWGSPMKKFVDLIKLGLKGTGNLTALVLGEKTAYQYNFPVKSGGESRAKPGRGIRENYLAFGVTNPAGQDFQIDRIEALLGQSNTRSTQ